MQPNLSRRPANIGNKQKFFFWLPENAINFEQFRASTFHILRALSVPWQWSTSKEIEMKKPKLTNEQERKWRKLFKDTQTNAIKWRSLEMWQITHNNFQLNFFPLMLAYLLVHWLARSLSEKETNAK
jgi:hypothetical protein